MKKILFCIMIFAHFNVSGQTTILEDDFINNKNEWKVRADTNFLVQIKNGVLRLEKFHVNRVKNGCLWYNQPVRGLNTLDNFSVMLDAKFVSGGDFAEMIDLQWGSREKDNSGNITGGLYKLSIFMNGRVHLDYFDSKWSYLIKKKVESIWHENFKPAQFNSYEVRQQEGFLIVNINGHELLRQVIKPIPGDIIGFQQCLKTAWEIDKIIVRQERPGKNPAASSSITDLSAANNLNAESNDDYWHRWNTNYREINAAHVLNSEKLYADSVEKNPEIPPYYARLDKYRFNAIYSGEVRRINRNVLNSMKNTLQLFTGNPSQLDTLTNSEVLFFVENKPVWMPIQIKILKALKEEARKNDNILLYCLFLNEHNHRNELYNSFLISEFRVR